MNKRDVLQDDLEEALAKEGCAICRISQRAVARILELILYDQVNEQNVRKAVRAGLGYCNRHAWQMRELRGSALGLTLLYRDALLQMQQQVAATAKPDGRGRFDKIRSQIARALSPHAECFGCQQQGEIEGRYLSSLLHVLPEKAFGQRLEASDGLCRLHLQRAVEMAPSAGVLKTLLDTHHVIWTRLLSELNEFLRKSDYRYASEGFGQEGDAWIRAVNMLASPQGTQR